jgi:hypothetical protein
LSRQHKKLVDATMMQPRIPKFPAYPELTTAGL